MLFCLVAVFAPTGVASIPTGVVSTPTGVASTPTGAAFDIVLILHIGFMLVGLASLLATGIQAWRAKAGSDAPAAASVARYFRPGTNWPGRSIYVVVVLGFVLIAMSRGAYDFGDPFVQIGLLLWIVAVTLAEVVVWPGEKHLQRIISSAPETASSAASRDGSGAGPGAGAGAGAGSACESVSSVFGEATDSGPGVVANPPPWAAAGESAGTARRVALAAWVVCVVLLIATVVMVQKP